MGATASSEARQLPQPQDIGEFRKQAGPPDFFVIPEVPEKRKVTDFKFTITFLVCLVVLVPFLIYTLVHSDLDRFIHGYDKCGNICGENNSVVDGITCSGGDMTTLPLLKFELNPDRSQPDEDIYRRDQCVRSCGENYVEIVNRCFPSENDDARESENVNSFLTDVVNDINRSAKYIVALCFIGFGFCIGMLLLFRYFVAVVVWVILVGSLLGIVVLTLFFWYLKSVSRPENENALMGLAVVFSIVSIILVIVLICMFKRIKLVIRLFKEAIRIIFDMPLILFEPLLTLLANTVLFIIFAYFIILFSTSGFLQEVSFGLYDYQPNVVMVFTLWFHVVICLWMSQFIIGCQHMVISGAVSAHYFARDKSSLNSPIYTSIYNLIKYHLGTVAFGSLIITIIAIIKALIRSLTNNRQVKLLIDCCLGAIEDFLKYLSKNAYIETAMHGQPFLKSGKRAVHLLAANFLSAVAVNSVGDFVLTMAKLLIVVCTVMVGVSLSDSTITHFWAAILIAAIVTAIMADCFFAVFETAIDTIFLCFCEDSSLNDGMERPYYMTTNLMQYIEDAKKTVKDRNQQQ